MRRQNSGPEVASPVATGVRTVAEWDAYIDEQIALNRKGRFLLRLTDGSGRALAGERVRVRQERLGFTLGVCPNGHVSVANRLACGEGALADAYWGWIGQLFNATTLWWGWRVTEPQRGQYAFDAACEGTHVQASTDPQTGERCWAQVPRTYGPWEGMLERARRLGHGLTGHALLYPRGDVAPHWINQLTAAEVKRHLEAVVRYTVRRYRDEVKVWHPVNEVFEGLQTVGPLKIDEGEVYRWVREEAPDAELVNNGGYEIEPDFFAQSIEKARRQGVEIDTLGIRGYHELYYADDLEGYKRRWNHFNELVERYGKWLRYTEIGANSEVARNGVHDPMLFVSGSAMHEGIVAVEPRNGQLPALSEATQAEFLKRMYKMVFAHPAMRECSYWDLLDDYTWNQCKGGLITAQRRTKQAYHTLHDLFHNEWKTDTTVTTDAEGIVSVDAYYGDYAIEAASMAVGHVQLDRAAPTAAPKTVVLAGSYAVSGGR